MTRKLKRPDGELMMEFMVASSHFFHNGKLTHQIQETIDGNYTGYFWWRHADGTFTGTFSERTAPKWLLALYKEATA